MKKFIIREDLLQAIGTYLLSRPMGEIRKIVEELEKLPLHKEEESVALKEVE